MNAFKRWGLSTVVAAGLSITALATAQETEELQPPELPSEEALAKSAESAPATLPETTETGPTEETVVEKVVAGQRVTEYYRNGELYLMTVKPVVGPTQYWTDRDHTGKFQDRHSGDVTEEFNLPKWRIGSW